MRYLFLIASALWLIARALTHHARQAIRRRGYRVRRYVLSQPLAAPPTAAGPVPVVLPSARTGVKAPPLPAKHRRAAAAPAPAPVDVLRTDRSRLGVAVLVDIAQQPTAVAA